MIPRKRLQPTQERMLEADPGEGGSRDPEVEYDDVYTRREEGERQKGSVQKLRQLQQNELQCLMEQGTLVQCCECGKWRRVMEFWSATQVCPEFYLVLLFFFIVLQNVLNIPNH